ncbi:hypothetical protein BDF19DRAFT_69129 [Syncephalis fuscata]|nr:hypothetical protein BDF19DRAFT_69129 [Syncephalis fuscata]
MCLVLIWCCLIAIPIHTVHCVCVCVCAASMLCSNNSGAYESTPVFFLFFLLYTTHTHIIVVVKEPPALHCRPCLLDKNSLTIQFKKKNRKRTKYYNHG